MIIMKVTDHERNEDIFLGLRLHFLAMATIAIISYQLMKSS